MRIPHPVSEFKLLGEKTKKRSAAIKKGAKQIIVLSFTLEPTNGNRVLSHFCVFRKILTG
jgi:hypothetical protein